MKRTFGTSRSRRPHSHVPAFAREADNISIAVTNRQRRHRIDPAQLRAGVCAVLNGEEIPKADISIAVVSDVAIHKINRQFLQHDEPTDVITFVLEQAAGYLDGEIVVSADTAASAARHFGWSIASELLLYVIHGALHLAGYDDLQVGLKRQMRARERHYLAQFGLRPPAEPSKLAHSKRSRPGSAKAQPSNQGIVRSK